MAKNRGTRLNQASNHKLKLGKEKIKRGLEIKDKRMDFFISFYSTIIKILSKVKSFEKLYAKILLNKR